MSSSDKNHCHNSTSICGISVLRVVTALRQVYPDPHRAQDKVMLQLKMRAIATLSLTMALRVKSQDYLFLITFTKSPVRPKAYPLRCPQIIKSLRRFTKALPVLRTTYPGKPKRSGWLRSVNSQGWKYKFR
jgi:hypothetical protein